MAERPLSGKPRTQVLRWQRQCWVVGLRWEERQKTLRRPPVHRRGVLNLRLTISRQTVKQGRSRLTAQGQIEGNWRQQKLYSLAALFSQCCVQDGYGVYQLGDGRQVFLATVNGMPSLMADVTGTPEEVARAQELFLSFNPAPAQGWHIMSSPENPGSWEGLVQAATAAQLRMVRLSGESNHLPAFAAGGLAVLLAGGFLWWWGSPDMPAGPTPEEIQARASELFSQPQEPVYLPHPWAGQPTVEAFLNRCQRWRAAVPVSPDRARLERGQCTAEGLEVVYTLLPGADAARFSERIRQVFNRTPVMNLVAGGKQGVVFVPWGAFTLQDEAAPEAAPQLMQAVSWFQSRQVAFSLTEVKDAPVMPGNGRDDTPPPVQDWREYTFSITEKRRPEWVLYGLDTRAVRLGLVAFTLSPQGQFTYQIEGHLYARK
ncbi:type 4b pilus protein PilO2 [Salmonella enterica subsp. diarizonae serovar 48:r:z]